MNKWGALFTMARAPAFQFYANDFMDATRLWEAIAVGLYVRCLCIQWTQGSIPADRRVLARAIHCERAELESCWDVLGPKFIDQGNGTLKNRRLEEVRARQIEVSEERSKAGKAGAIAKANAKSLASDLLQAKAKQRKVKEKEKVEREDEGEGSKAHEPEIIPSGMSVELFQAIKRWEQYRREKRNTLTPSGRAAFVNKCQAWGDARAIAAIDHSIAQGWTGCFEPKTTTNGRSVKTAEEHTAGVAAATAALLARRRNERELARAHGLHNDQSGAGNPDPVPSGEVDREG